MFNNDSFNKSHSKIDSLPGVYQNSNDSRSSNQIFFTNQIITLISQLNLQRIRASQGIIQNHIDSLKKDQPLFFICLTGMPNFVNEYKNLQLPGQMVVYTITGLSRTKQYSKQQYIKIYKSSSFDLQADNIHRIVNEGVLKNKKIFVIFHSYGSFVMDAYLTKYGCNTQNIIGLVDMAGIPITMYKRIKYGLQFLLTISNNFYESLEEQQKLHTILLQNAELVYQKYKQYSGNLKKYQKQLMMSFDNQYALILHLKYVSSTLFHKIFTRVRSYPNILKLFLVGSKDTIFQERLSNQKFIYYCLPKLSQRLNQDYKKSLRSSYIKLHNKVIDMDKFQEKYVINFKEGKHSIHVQEKIVPDIKLALNQYIVLVWLAYSTRKQLNK